MFSVFTQQDKHLNTWIQASSNLTLDVSVHSVCGKSHSKWVMRLLKCVASVKSALKEANIQVDLKTNSCKGIGSSMTSVDKRSCVSFSGAGDSSAPQAGGEALQQRGRDGRNIKNSASRELRLRLARSMIGVISTAVLTGGFVARSVKNESLCRCGVFIMSTFDVRKLIGKHETRAWRRLEEVTENAEKHFKIKITYQLNWRIFHVVCKW